MAHRLSADDIAHYQTQGFVIPRYRLEPEFLKGLQDALNSLIANNPGVRPEKLVSAHIEGRNDEGVHGSQRFLELAMHKPKLSLPDWLAESCSRRPTLSPGISRTSGSSMRAWAGISALTRIDVPSLVASLVW